MHPYSLFLRRAELLTFLLGPNVQKLLQGLPEAGRSYIFYLRTSIWKQGKIHSKNMLANKIYGIPMGAFT